MANRYAIAGFGCVALAMVGAVLFVADVVLASRAAAIAAVIAASGALWSWYLQPLLRRRYLHRRHEQARTDPSPVRLINANRHPTSRADWPRP